MSLSRAQIKSAGNRLKTFRPKVLEIANKIETSLIPRILHLHAELPSGSSWRYA